MPPFNGKRPHIKQKVKLNNLKGTIFRLFNYLKPHSFKLIVVGICILISSASLIFFGIILGDIVDNGIVPLIGKATPDYSYFYYLIPRLVGIMFLGIVCSYLYSRIMLNVSQSVLRTIRNEMFVKMQKLPLSYFDTKEHGDIMSRYTNDIDAMVNLLTQSLPQLFNNSIQIIGVIIAMLILSWQLSIIVFVSILFMYFLITVLGEKSGNYFAKQQSSLGKENAYIEEMIAGVKVVKVFNREDKIKEKFDQLNEELCENSTKANMYANIFMPIIHGFGYVQYVILAFAGGYLAVNGLWGITLGKIVSFLQLSKNLTDPVSQIGQQVNAVVQAFAGAERVFELIDEKGETDPGLVELVKIKSDTSDYFAWKSENNLIKLQGNVDFANINFSYIKDKPILKNISLSAKSGQTIAFVGSTGAGKTTVTNLLNRFYDIDEGRIIYDGIDIKNIKKDSLRKSLGIVLQDTNLFTGTIKENILFGNLDASDEEVIKAAKLANADDFISLLPNGYDTLIDGSNNSLSMGQRQLLSIARAVIADPPVLILDEATSSIDSRTEAKIQEGMKRLMVGRTVFIIAHRLSTIRNSDTILVIENGEIVERGSHSQLLNSKGYYYRLYKGLSRLD